MRSLVLGRSGRLGRVISQTLKARGDTLVTDESRLRAPLYGWSPPVNYLVFAHRYRGEPSYEKEMFANLEWVAKWIDSQIWAKGDRAIVIVSSICSTWPAMNQSLAYNLSKAALNQLARYYAKSQAVRVNTVSPDTFTGKNPKVRIEDVANVIAFLCSERAMGINGQDIRVTG